MLSPLARYSTLARPAKAALWFVVCGVIQRGIGVVVIPVFTRIMTTEEFGQYTLFSSWLDILAVFVTLRLSWGVFMQGLIRYDHDPDEYTSSLQGLTTLLVIVGLAIYLPLQGFWNSITGLNSFLMLCAFASAWATAMFGFWSTRQRVSYNYRLLVAVTLIVAIAEPASGILAVLSVEAGKVEARAACMAAVQLLFYSFMFVYYTVKGRKLFVREYWTHALRFNLPLVPHYLSQTALAQVGRVVVGAFTGAAAAGIYGLATSVSNFMGFVNQAIMNALNPWIYQKIKEGDCAAIAGVSYMAFALYGVANLLVVAFAPEIFWLFAPADYYGGVWAVPPLTAGAFVMFMYGFFADFEFYYERTSLVTVASVTGAVANLLLNLLLVPQFGFVAAGYATLASNALYIFMHYRFMRRVQRDEMGGARVYSARAVGGLCVAYAAAATALAALYPLLAARVLLVGAMAVAVIANRKRLHAAWNDVRSARNSA